jgi:hypothetical protein
MKKFFKTDLTFIVELLSALSFLMMSISIGASESIAANTKNAYFWMVIFFTISFIQFLSLKTQYNLNLLRISMAWITGSLWVALGLGLSNNTLSVPIIMIGLFNIYAFVALIRKATPNWQKFFIQ